MDELDYCCVAEFLEEFLLILLLDVTFRDDVTDNSLRGYKQQYMKSTKMSDNDRRIHHKPEGMLPQRLFR